MKARPKIAVIAALALAAYMQPAAVQAEYSDCRDFGATAYHTGQAGVTASRQMPFLSD